MTLRVFHFTLHLIHFSCLLFITTIHDFLPFFFFNDTATTEIYTLSLHDALPIFEFAQSLPHDRLGEVSPAYLWLDRKSTRLNSSHLGISYAVFCLKKKKIQ